MKGLLSEKKILTQEALRAFVLQARLKNKKVVFTNGCFDVLHYGHVDYLERARFLGDCLVIGLNSDDSVRSLKGETRPVNDVYARARVLAALWFVDALTVFDAPTPYELIQSLTPDVLVKGGDYTPENVVGAELVTQAGGRVEILPFVEGYSSSALLQKINDV